MGFCAFLALSPTLPLLLLLGVSLALPPVLQLGCYFPGSLSVGVSPCDRPHCLPAAPFPLSALPPCALLCALPHAHPWRCPTEGGHSDADSLYAVRLLVAGIWVGRSLLWPAPQSGIFLPLPLRVRQGHLAPGGQSREGGQAWRLRGQLAHDPHARGAWRPQARLSPSAKNKPVFIPVGEGTSHCGGLRRKTGGSR